MGHKASHHVPWRQLPPFVRRRYIRFLVYVVVGLAAILLLIGLSVVAYPQLSSSSFLMYSTFAYPGISLLLLSLWDKRLTRRLKAVEYRLCPECGSHLTDLSGETACPECSAPCNIEQVVKAWKVFSYRWWRDAPPLARRHYWRWIIVCLLLLGIILATLPINLYKMAGLRWSLVFYGLWALSMPVLMYFALESHKRLVKRLESAGFKLCPKCGYPLTGLTGKTRCPECGLQLDVDQVEYAWRRYRSIRTGPFV